MRFIGRWAFLSNFCPSPITIGGITYPTAEHAYQAQKAYKDEDRQKVLNAKTPGEAKRIGRNIPTRGDWNAVRIDVMRAVIAAKFAEPSMARRLIETGNIEIVEDNYWGDQFWGVCAGSGQNWLGRLLMEERARLKGLNGAD
jgi:N-glycosidase YbiA